jgi:hypothetical protein
MNHASTFAPARFSSAGIVWIKLSVIYLVAGIAMGIGMGAAENFTLRPVHAHINLIGWATLALAGLIYSVFPQAAHSRLAKIHFWLYNLGTPLMLATLTAFLLGYKQVLPAMVISEFTVAAAILAFAANMLTNLKAE